MGKEFRHELREEGYEDVGSYGFGSVVARVLGRAYAALTLTLAVVVAFGSFVPWAFAANQYNPQMVIDGNVVDGTSKGYMCVDCNPFTATLELIGKMGDYVTITSDKYQALTEGGGFHNVMARWEELTSDATADMQNTWLGGDGFVDGWLILSGQGNCWYGTFTDNQVEGALVWYERVMSGGSGGGSSSGSSLVMYPNWAMRDTSSYSRWDYVTTNIDGVYYTTRLDNDGTAYSDYEKYSDTVTYSFGDGFSLPALPDGYTADDVYMYETDLGTDITLVITKSDTVKLDTVTMTSSTGVTYPFKRVIGDGKGLYRLIIDIEDYTVTSLGHVEITDYTVGNWSTFTNNLSFQPNIIYTNLTGQLSESFDGAGGGGGSDEPDDPEVPDEPDEPGPSPTAPEPPDLPDIGDPIVPREPDPTPPTTEPTPPTLPTPITVTVPTGTSPADYTPWLRAILEELKNINVALNSYLQSIIDEMAEHCQHIRDEMGTQATYLGECLDSVASAAAGVGDQIEGAMHDYSEWLSEYLDGLAEWMVEHMSYNTTVENNVTADPYDDTSLMYWIKRIYTKLGAGSPVNRRPKDPVSNPTETNTWWEELWEKILKELANMFPNLAIDLGLIFDDLKGKFPLSIPWDLHALLLLMVTDPVAPHVRIPAYALTADMELEQVATYDMDFDVYTPYMTGIHLMFEVAWVGYLLSKTKDYMQLIEGVIPS